jgi:hypothetical protein
MTRPTHTAPAIVSWIVIRRPGDHFIAGLGRFFLITLDILIVNVAISLRIRPTGHE